MLTDTQIDALEGAELQRAWAEADGWTGIRRSNAFGGNTGTGLTGVHPFAHIHINVPRVQSNWDAAGQLFDELAAVGLEPCIGTQPHGKYGAWLSLASKPTANAPTPQNAITRLWLKAHYAGLLNKETD